MKPKIRRCREKAEGCQVEYSPRSSFQATCHNPACAAKKAKRDREKREARLRSESTKEKQQHKEEFMTIRQREVRARKAAQEFARLRDMKWFIDRGEAPKCILCGKVEASSWHGCHFVPVGTKGGPRSLHPANINLGCGQCNFYADQGSSQYRENMVRKYGVEMVAYLETARVDYRLTAEEIDEIRDHYRSEVKRIRKELNG